MLQKAGLLENKELSDQLLETERKQELLMKVLIEVSGKMLKPVYREDTLYPELEIIKLTPQNTTGVIKMEAKVFNQNKIF